ncbi:hypothetical protein VTN31DRAFT_4681 [Thermomyces dupontii]|uniref:mitochondrial 54S ribosomal protein bL21m n=1 Tax=Talaromyces thermophilus TaxID=28565 RepID=UPI0037443E9C
MFSRTTLRALFCAERTAFQSQSPLALALGPRAFLSTSTTTTTSSSTSSRLNEIPPTTSPTTSTATTTQTQPSNPESSTTQFQPPREKLPLPPIFTSPLRISKSLAAQLPYLTAQPPPYYITAHLHARPYLLTEGDHVRLPFRMPGVKSGDILRLNRASVLGSRDFTLKGGSNISGKDGPGYLDERLFECRVRVLGVDAEPLRIKEKTKRRQRHVRRVKSKHKYTLLRVMTVRVKTLDELLREGAQIVEDGELEREAVVERKQG